MPLTKCRECGHTVSTEALTCPQCGVPKPSRQNRASSPNFEQKPKKLGFFRGCALFIVLSGIIASAIVVVVAVIDVNRKIEIDKSELAKAEAFRTERQNREREARISNLIQEIKESTDGRTRTEKIGKLLQIDPDTKEFPDEVGGVREKIKKDLAEKKARAERENQIRSSFSAWDGSHRGLEKFIKNSMNDPKSYEHVETRYADLGDHLIVTTIFRGKNAFGGVVKNSVKAKVDLNGNVLTILDSGK